MRISRVVESTPQSTRPKWDLVRIDDAEYSRCLCRSLAIEEDYGFYLSPQFRSDPGQLNLAQVYLTLKHLSGESSRRLDDNKQGFCFPFRFDVGGGGQTFAYLLIIQTIRDSLYYSLQKLVDPADERLKVDRIHPPFEAAFGKDEMRLFRGHLRGYLKEKWHMLRPEHLEPFVRRIPANLVLFGYCDGNAYEEHFDSVEAYDAAWKRLQEKRCAERHPSADDCSLAR